VREGLLNATSINKTIARLAQILDIAVERELIDRNPARGRRRELRQRAPERTWLDRAEQIEALLQDAGELDSEARVDRRATPRRALLATLTLAGLRISEALSLRWRDVDLSAGRLRVRGSKTDAGVRQVDLLPALREELSTHKAQTRFGWPDDFVFPTERGGRANPTNVRKRIMARTIERANEKLASQGSAPLSDGLTPARAAPHLYLAAARDRGGGGLRHAPGRARRSEGDALDLRPGDVPRRGRAGAPEGPRRGPRLGTAGY
jgi:integrase